MQLTKTILAVFAVFVSSLGASAQMKVHPDGSIEIHSQTTNWGRAVYTVVQNPQACAYHLCNNSVGNDVFYVCALGWTWCLGGGYTGSDSLFKYNILPIDSPLKVISSITGRQFIYKNDPDKQTRFGFIAQEVEQTHPELVKTMHNGTKAISYDDFIAILLEGIKEQQSQIEALKEEIAQIAEELKTLKNNH